MYWFLFNFSFLCFKFCKLYFKKSALSLVFPADVSEFLLLTATKPIRLSVSLLVVQDQTFSFCPGWSCSRLKGHSCLCSLMSRTRSINFCVWLSIGLLLLALAFLGLIVYCFCRGGPYLSILFLYSWLSLCLRCVFENLFGETGVCKWKTTKFCLLLLGFHLKLSLSLELAMQSRL